MLKLLLRNNFGEVFPGHKYNSQFPTNNPDFCRIERYYSKLNEDLHNRFMETLMN